MSTKKKKDEEAVEAAEIQKSLDQLVLDRKVGKYAVVPLISFWAKELRKQEQHRHLTQTELLDLAMSEVLGGKVDEKELAKKVLEAGEASDAAIEAAAERPKKKSSA